MLDKLLGMRNCCVPYGEIRGRFLGHISFLDRGRSQTSNVVLTDFGSWADYLSQEMKHSIATTEVSVKSWCFTSFDHIITKYPDVCSNDPPAGSVSGGTPVIPGPLLSLRKFSTIP